MEFTFTNVDIISDNVGTKGTVFSGLGDDGFFSPTGTLQTNGSGFVFTPGSFVPVSVDPSTVVFDPVTGEAVSGDAVDFFTNSGDQVDFNFINGGIDFINPDLTFDLSGRPAPTADFGSFTTTATSITYIKPPQSQLEGFNFSFTPVAVPEPSSTALLGLGGLAFLARRKRS